MLNVVFPANASYFFTFVVDVVNFNIIPTDKIVDFMFKYKDQAE